MVDGVYRAEFFGFSYTLPNGWTVHGGATERLLTQAGGDLISRDDTAKKRPMESARKRLSRSRTMFEFPPKTPGNLRPGVQVIAQNMALARGRQTGSDSILAAEKVIEDNQSETNEEGEAVEEALDGISFYRQNIAMVANNATVLELCCSAMLIRIGSLRPLSGAR